MRRTQYWKMLTCAALSALLLLMAGCTDDAPNDSNNQDSDAGVCQPGESKQVDCNTCTCDEGGGWSCTEMACMDAGADAADAPDADASDAQEPDADIMCTEGDTRAQDCNLCTCQADGTWVCTQRDCAIVAPCEGKVCGDVCSTCVPDADGSCPPVMEYCDADGECTPGGDQTCDADDEACSEGDTKMDDCNSCICDADGNWSCTEMDCSVVDHCAGLACGESCSTCDPDQTGGVCPTVEEYCDQDGICSGEVPTC